MLIGFVFVLREVLGCWGIDNKERGPELRTRSLGIAKHLNHYIRVKAHAILREHQLLLFVVPYFWRF